MLTQQNHSRSSYPRTLSQSSAENHNPYASISTQSSLSQFSFSSIDASGGSKLLPDPTTISSQQSKRARLSPPEDDEGCIRGAVMVDSVKNAIWNALNHYAFEDAIFAAERLYAESNSDETAFLLATCLYRAGDKHRAFEVLSRCHPEQASQEIRYLFGKICCDLDDYHKAESVLANSSVFSKPYSIEDLENYYKPETLSYALQLLGVIHQKSQRKELAAAAMNRALSLNPFQWSSFENLCRMKEHVDTKATFFRAVTSKSSQSLDLHSEDEGTPPETTSHTANDIDMLPAEEEAVRTASATVIPAPLSSTSPIKPPPAKRAIDKATTPVKNPIMNAKLRMRPIVEESNTSVMPAHNIASTPVISSYSPSLRSPNTYSSPQSSNSQLNIVSMDSSGIRNSVAKKVKSKPPFRPTSFSNSTQESPISRARRPSETSLSSSLSSPQPPTLRRSSRLQANKTSSAVKENKTLKKRDDFDNVKLNKKMNSFEDGLNLKSENGLELMEKVENGPMVRKMNVIEPIKKEPIIRQKRKKEPALLIVPKTPQTQTAETVLTEQERVTALVMRSYYRFGEVVQALHNYDIRTGLTKLRNVSLEEQETPYYWYLKGRLHFEVLEYDKSVAAFAEMRRKNPYFMKGIDYYSVALWHLQKEKDLAVLAKYLVEHYKNAPETYIVFGNVFSLQREHETAIKLFRRALQLQPNYAYALTLLGHEYISLDEVDKAVQCFRLAISVEPGHYNGWYGLGLVAYKQEQYASALSSFKRALAVYPTNPVILVNLAVAQHTQKLSNEALRTLTSAVNSFPNNPLCRFHRASLFYSLGRLDEAMQELNKLKDMVPKESLVYFLMGKVSKRTDNTHMALMYFSKAMDLDPKGTNNQIKETFNKLYGGVEEDSVPQRAASGTTTSHVSEM